MIVDCKSICFDFEIEEKFKGFHFIIGILRNNLMAGNTYKFAYSTHSHTYPTQSGGTIGIPTKFLM